MVPKHISVLEAEVVGAFEGVSIGTFFDGTVGAGSHFTGTP